MTHTEVRELFLKKLDDAQSSIESAKNAEALTVNTSISYVNDKYEESTEYDEKGSTSIIGSIEIKISGCDGEDAPFVSIGMIADLNRGRIKSDAELADSLDEFDDAISEFAVGLSSAESVEEFITAESKKLDEENERIVKELEEKLAKINKFMKIGTFALIGLLIITFALKLFL